jgi:N-acetyl-anhydromuramyl-L-alanine amidase AmpD
MNLVVAITSAGVCLVSVNTQAMVASASSISENKLVSELANASGKTMLDGRPLKQSATHTTPSPVRAMASPAGQPTPECPPTLRCVFTPAAHQQDDPADPSNYGNYDVANRPADGLGINTVVIHDTEGSLADTLAAFQDPLFYVSAHYVIDSDGTVYQMVRTKDIAWHAGNWYVNQHSIGIEHIGHAVNGSTEYTPAMYAASATLVRYLASKYSIPHDRQHIIGHDNVSAPTAPFIPGMHWDPGPFWNWQAYMTLLGAPILPTASPRSSLITIAPQWQLNKPPVIDCSSGICTTFPRQSANFVYLHTKPDDTAPLVNDPVLGPGTTAIENTAAKAYAGQQFAVAKIQPDTTHVGLWYQIWYAGQVAWLHSPLTNPTAIPASGKYITPKAGRTSIPVYGRAYPEGSAYPARFTAAQPVVALPYAIQPGQRYTTTGLAPTDYYYAWTINSSVPYDHTVFKGTDKYLLIQYNGRTGFVRAADVDVGN